MRRNAAPDEDDVNVLASMRALYGGCVSYRELSKSKGISNKPMNGIGAIEEQGSNGSEPAGSMYSASRFRSTCSTVQLLL